MPPLYSPSTPFFNSHNFLGLDTPFSFFGLGDALCLLLLLLLGGATVVDEGLLDLC